ncbi:MAG: hypothetical protein EA394_08895 [Bacteroidia bacterium]|nr:MAG: hypothetical protein EA394_08895 [Bacteroidia bacterium]
MHIVNPIYDTAFKYLMDNNQLAKKVLSVILDTEVLEVSLGQQEVTWPDGNRGLAMFRLDFKALIKGPGGSSQTVLIELQKSKYDTDIRRFRNYLAGNYMTGRKAGKSDIAVADDPGSDYRPMYPIIAVYILGYTLDDLPHLAVTVNRDVIDSVSKKKLRVKSFFIEHLTHRSHIIQLPRLPETRRSRLERFLAMFNQRWATADGYVLNLQELDDEFADIARYLQGPLLDDHFRRQLLVEEELDIIFENQERKYLQKIEEAEKQTKKAREEKLQLHRERTKLIQREHDERQKKEEAIKSQHILASKFVEHLKSEGYSVEEIAAKTGLPLNMVKKM